MPDHKTSTAETPISKLNRRERRREETTQKLFHAALQLFAERGYANTTVEDITEAADVGKGTFFNYFPSKEHILLTLAQVQRGKYERARDALQQKNASARKIMRALYHELPERLIGGPMLVRSLLSVFLSSDQVRQTMTARLAEARELLVPVIEHGQRNGELRTDRKPQEIALAFQQTLFGTVLLWTLMMTPDDAEQCLDKAFDNFWYGIASRPDGNRRSR